MAQWKEFLGACAVVIALIQGGARLAPDSAVIGLTLLAAGGLVLIGSIGVFFVWPAYTRRVTTQVVSWLSECGNFGTRAIQNARGIHTDTDAAELRTLFNEWNAIVVEGTKWYCQVTDANELDYLDYWRGPAFEGTAPNGDDGHVRAMANETVRRIRDLTRRLDRGETQLRRFRLFPKAKKHVRFSSPSTIPAGSRESVRSGATI